MKSIVDWDISLFPEYLQLKQYKVRGGVWPSWDFTIEWVPGIISLHLSGEMSSPFTADQHDLSSVVQYKRINF